VGVERRKSLDALFESNSDGGFNRLHQRTYAERLGSPYPAQATGHPDPSCALGADGLNLERQTLACKTGAHLVALAPSMAAAIDASLSSAPFANCGPEGFDMRLAIYGHAFDTTHEVASEVVAAARIEPLLEHSSGATDGDVMDGPATFDARQISI